jgi:hypothetical protein
MEGTAKRRALQHLQPSKKLEMLNADDPGSVMSLRRLKEVASAGDRPLVFWVGAGSSRWLGYPGWKDLTLQLRKNFFQAVAGFDNQGAQGLISKEDFPAMFQMCRDLDSARYYRFVADAFVPPQAPKWLRYPYLRLGHLVQTAALCTEYGIQAAKVPFGGVQLTTAAFGIQSADWQADHLASYAVSGAFDSDLGALVQQDMSILRGVVRVRSSAEGESFRRETGQVLAVQSGGAFSASVNAGLSRTIPVAVLQRAHDRLLRLMTESARVTRVPAVWGSSLQSDASTRFWRMKSQKMLLEICTTRGIGKNDPCICGSGEKFRLCCLPPLRP